MDLVLSRAVFRIFSRKGWGFHGGKAKKFHGWKNNFHGKKKNAGGYLFSNECRYRSPASTLTRLVVVEVVETEAINASHAKI